MALISACKDLHEVLSRTGSLMIATYRYAPGRFKVSLLRGASVEIARAVIAEARAQHLINIERDATVRVAIPPESSVKQWLASLAKALAGLLQPTRRKP